MFLLTIFGYFFTTNIFKRNYAYENRMKKDGGDLTGSKK